MFKVIIAALIPVIFSIVFSGCSNINNNHKKLEISTQKEIFNLNEQIQQDLKKSIYKSEKLGLYLSGDYSHSLIWLYGLNFYENKDLIKMKSFTDSSLLEPGFGLQNLAPMYFAKIFKTNIPYLDTFAQSKSFKSFMDMYNFYYNKYFNVTDSFAYYEINQDVKNKKEFFKCINNKNKLKKEYLSYLPTVDITKDSLTVSGEHIADYDFTYEWFIMCLLNDKIGDNNGNKH